MQLLSQKRLSCLGLASTAQKRTCCDVIKSAASARGVTHPTGSSLSLTGRWVSGGAKPDWAGVGDFDGDRRMDVAWYESWNNTSVSVGLAR